MDYAAKKKEIDEQFTQLKARRTLLQGQIDEAKTAIDDINASMNRLQGQWALLDEIEKGEKLATAAPTAVDPVQPMESVNATNKTDA